MKKIEVPCWFIFFVFTCLSIISILSFAQNRTISGKVISAKDETPLEGVNIMVKGTEKSTTTNAKGTYRIVINRRDDKELVFSLEGYESQTIKIGTKGTINVELMPDATTVLEPIHIGYGMQDRRVLAGAITSINLKNTEQMPLASPDLLLQGRGAGILVNSHSGTPNAGATVWVRGVSSILASSSPLYVIDGVPVLPTDLSSQDVGGQIANPLSDLNPADIERIEVLKDGSATAIYGSRAANGVVLIQTKRGTKGKPMVNFSILYGEQSTQKRPEIADASTFQQLMNEAATNNGLTPPFANPTQTNANVNYPSQVFQSAAVRNINFSIAGGDSTVKYLFSFNNWNQDGIVKPAAFDRKTFRLNLDFDWSEKIKAGANLLYARGTNERMQNDTDALNGVLGTSANFLPNLPTFQANGSYTKSGIYANPLATLNEQGNTLLTNRFLGNIFANYYFTEDLFFKTSWSLNYQNAQENLYYSTATNFSQGRGVSAHTFENQYVIENTLHYQTLIGYNKHQIHAVIGNTVQENILKRTIAEGQNFPTNNFTNVGAAFIRNSFAGNTSWALLSWFARFNYAYKGKYMANLTVRTDGSSRFGTDNRWGTFPAVGLAWNIKEEKFLEKVKAISSMKIRASYGLAGNQNFTNFSNNPNAILLSNYIAQGLWNSGANYADWLGIEPVQLANPKLKWETTAQMNVGLDVGLLKDKINLSIEYYQKQTSDVLVPVSIPRSTGFATQIQNIGQVENKGIEINLNAKILNKKDLTWDLYFNVATNQNTITSLSNTYSSFENGVIRFEEGSPMYSFWLHKQNGVNAENGNILLESRNTVFNPATDRFIIGNALPQFYGGFANVVNWNGLELTVFVQFTQGNKQLNWSRYAQEHGGTRNANFSISQLDRWQRTGDITNVPKMTDANYENIYASRFLEDGSFVRLKNIVLAYHLPKEVAEKVKLQTAKIYLSVQNLLTFTKYKGLDPETNAGGGYPAVQGVEFYTVPQARWLTAGVQIGF
ncbi:SusC/RagA family TonB-linked outer membrane protein [Thermoflexibacter ruber]|uniref:TonB-linked outer membrane protein, SusC/RagA family n=1 Tax=Thermoflexibacter ruber TaxID=1003 RepID=A0A1I2D2H2_9BACT|nr:TonB-dependent receptor [Thermoflexibacter ruber]SFE74722.1 TonB-linked outer membrane protein, SusC/RagA family [Thermoflexibacter ruber]